MTGSTCAPTTMAAAWPGGARDACRRRLRWRLAAAAATGRPGGGLRDGGGVAACSPVDGYENGCARRLVLRWCGGFPTGGGGGTAAVAGVVPATAPIGGGDEAGGGGTKSPSMPQAYSDVIMSNHEWKRAW